MDMVGHNDKFVELKDSAIAISEKGFDKNCCCPFRPEESSSLPSHGGHEKRTICEIIHFHSG